MPLIDRKALLNELAERANLPCLSYVLGFVDGDVLFETMDKLGHEGVVSKRTSSKYRSGRTRDWLKIKTPVVSRKWWKFPVSALRACEVSVPQAARSRGIGSMG